MSVIYEILIYNMVGKIIECYIPIKVDSIESNNENKIVAVVDGVTIDYFKKRKNSNTYYSLSPIGFEYNADKYLPYFADVTEDVPQCYKKIAKTYPNCQLMMEKYGSGYLQFYSHAEKEVLRIAINSHNYNPCKDN